MSFHPLCLTEYPGRSLLVFSQAEVSVSESVEVPAHVESETVEPELDQELDLELGPVELDAHVDPVYTPRYRKRHP